MKANSGFKSLLILIGLLTLLVTGCKKDKDLNKDDEDTIGSPVTIMGNMDVSATEAVKVLAISTTNTYKLADITNNRFSLVLDNGKPWGLIFLNSAEQPLGLLSLGNGIEALPLQGVGASTDSIDLQTISRNGNVFTPAHNPIGNEIPLTAQQMLIVAGMDDYLAALLRNPDVNGNGQIDLLEGKFFKLSVIYFMHPGRFQGADLTPTLNTNTVVDGFRFYLTVKDQSYPETIYYTGPSGSQCANTPSESYMTFSNHRVYSTSYIYDAMATANFIPPGGVYTINYNGQTLSFNLADQSYVVNNIVYPWPTLTLNANGTMNKIDWSYHFPGGTINDLSALIKNISLQLEGDGNKCSNHQYQSMLYTTDRLPISTVTHTFSCQDIDWGTGTPAPGWKHIDRVMMTYEDHYATPYVVEYERSY